MGLFHGFAWESSHLQTAVMVFGCGQSPLSTAYKTVCTIRFAHTAYSFRSSSFSPHRWRQSKKYARHKSIAYIFCYLAVRAPPAGVYRRWHRKPRIVLLALTPGSLSCHAKQATHVLRLSIFNTTGAAPVNAWRRTVTQK